MQKFKEIFYGLLEEKSCGNKMKEMIDMEDEKFDEMAIKKFGEKRYKKMKEEMKREEIIDEMQDEELEESLSAINDDIKWLYKKMPIDRSENTNRVSRGETKPETLHSAMKEISTFTDKMVAVSRARPSKGINDIIKTGRKVYDNIQKHLLDIGYID